MADEKEKTNLEHLGEETKNAIGSANLMQGLMGQIYDIFTTGGDVANASEDNFFCWLTPGVPVTPEQFEFATEGLSGVIRAKTPSQRKASQASEDAMDHVVNQIIKRRVEEIANRQMAVETDDAHPDEEEQRRRAKELEAQKAKEASQQDTDPKLAAVKALGDAKEAEAAPEAEAADAPEAPAAVAEAAAEEAEKITYDKVPVSDEGSIVNQETEGLSEADLEALKAERTTLLYMQAENFANMVNFIPDVSGRSDKEKTGLAVLENEGSLVDVYSRVLMMSEVAHYELDEKVKERLAKARSVLTTTVMKATDLLSDEKTPVEVDSPYVEAYNAKMAAYIDACLEYNNRRIAAGAGGDARAVHDWALNASLYRRKVTAAMDAWVGQGYKNQIEQISAEIANITEKDLSLLKAQYKEILQRSMMTGLVSGVEFPFTTISPANFAHASSWTDFTFSMQRYKDHTNSDVNNNSLKIDQTSTSWFHKQHYNYGKDAQFQELDLGLELTNVDVSFKICQVNIVRPWFKPSFLTSKSWRFAPGSEEGKTGTVLSSGGAKPEGILPAYPTAMLLVKDVVFDFHDTQIARDFKHKYDEVSHDGGLGVSIGFFGIGAKGNVSYLDNKKHDGTEVGIEQNQSRITIPGMQIIGYRCHVMEKSPDPLPSIKDWA